METLTKEERLAKKKAAQERGIVYLEEKLSLDPKNYMVKLDLAELYVKTKTKIEIAREYLEEMASLEDSHRAGTGPDKLKMSRMNRARIYGLLGREEIKSQKALPKKQRNFSLAIRLLKQSVGYSGSHETLLELGRCLGQEGFYQEGLNYLLQIDDYQDSRVYYERGILEKRLGRYSEAKEDFQIAIEIHNDLYAKFELAKIAREEGDLKTARQLLHELLREKPRDIYALYELGRLEASVRSFQEARHLFGSIIKINPNDVNTYLELSKIKVDHFQYEKALQYLKQAKEANDRVHVLPHGNDTITISEARIKIRMGNYEEASSLLEKISTPHYSALALCLKAELDMMLGNLEETKKALFDNNEIDHSGFVSLTAGKLKTKLGLIEEARVDFHSVLEFPYTAYALAELIKLEIGEGNYPLAWRYLEEAKAHAAWLLTTEKENAEAFLKYQFGTLEITKENQNDYFVNQLTNYQRERTMEHITYVNLTKQIWYEEEMEENRLSRTIDLLEEQIELREPDQKGILDQYIVKLDHPVAMVHHAETSRMKVFTISRQKKIFSIEPIDNRIRGRIDLEETPYTYVKK